VLFVEAARGLGFGARLVSGYLFNPDQMHVGSTDAGSTHAWAAVFVSGAGWISFDPTNRSIGGASLIPVAVARDIRQAAPVSGAYAGNSDALQSMSVEVLVTSGAAPGWRHRNNRRASARRMAERTASRPDRMRRSRATKDLADGMTHAALTPRLGREFDNFLFSSIDDDRNDPLLSVVSALARLEVDPWKEAASLARMPRDRAKQRLTSLIASLPKGAATSLSPEIIAARLISLLPQAGSVNTAAPATLRQVAPIPHSRLFVGLCLVALLLVGYFIFAARASNAPEGAPGATSAPSEPAARR
jgi:hypothetical protein